MQQDYFKYFAYGSNMLTVRIKERCPSANSLGVAKLCGYELKWDKKSGKDGSGKCHIVPSDRPDASVFGVLYEIKKCEEEKLDTAEGLGKGYKEEKVKVLHDSDTVEAKTYIATAIDPDVKPYSWYREYAIVGAQEHRLPESYINQLKSIPVCEDSDLNRHNHHMNIISNCRQMICNHR